MSDTKDEREYVHIALIQGAGDDWRAAFVIDGRRYGTAEQMRTDLREAFDYIEDHGIPAEFEVRPARSTEPDTGLPSWSEYKAAHRDV